MAKNEKTSKEVAAIAAKMLRNPKTPDFMKKIAASALTQAPDRKKKQHLKEGQLITALFFYIKLEKRKFYV